jgi:hypothetical protein
MEAVPQTLPSPMSFTQRLVGMFTSPVKVFESLRANPAFFGMLLFFTLVGAVSYLPIHKVIQREAVTNMVEQVEGNDNIPADKKEEVLEQQRSFMEGPGFLFAALGGSLVFAPLMMFFWGFLVWLLYGFSSGGDITFKHALAAVCHLGILFLAAGLIKIPLILAKGSAQVATSLALLSPDPDPHSVLYAFLDSFDLFTFAILAVLATGMVKLARISPAKSWTMAIILFVIGLCFRVGGAMMGEMFSGMGGGH